MFWKDRKRKKLREQAPPSGWTGVLAGVPLWELLPGEDRVELLGHIQVFLAEKQFEGARGFAITEEMRLVVAAQACVLLLHRESDYFPGMKTILVYPDQFAVDVVEAEDDFLVSEYTEERAGESWDYGPVVLSWKDVELSMAHPEDGYNVVLHEFAHQLDLENGAVDGAPRLPDAAAQEAWKHVFTEAYEKHTRDVDRGRRTAIDEYGADGPPEFFAVVVEAFFEMPRVLRSAYPAVYDQLVGYFQQDPSRWASHRVDR